MKKDRGKAVATHQTCPKCGHNDCATVYENGVYCHSECGWIPNAKVDTITDNFIQPAETAEIKSVNGQVLRNQYTEKYTTHRGIPAHINEFFGIKTGLDEEGNEVYRVYPYPQGDQIRVLPKNFKYNRGFANSHLFAMDKFNAGSGKYITIVEGAEDVPSAYYMLGEKFPVVALPNASPSEKLMQNCFKFLDAYDEIIVAIDNDEAGEKAAERLSKLFPNKVSRVSLTKGDHKDANDFLQAGDASDFVWAWRNRKKYVPAGVYNTPDQFLGILHDESVNEYVPTPIEALNYMTKGLVRGHLHVITGPEGQGKTEILRMLEFELIKNHPEIPIAVLHMEESKKMCILSYACYDLGMDVRDPDHDVPQETIENSIKGLTKGNNLYLFDFEDENPFAIFDRVTYFATACGVQFIFIDPIQQLTYGKNSDLTEEQVLSKIAVKLEKMANDLNVGIILTTHVNDDGQTRSSRMIGKSASIRIDLSRKHMDDDPDIKNTTYLSVSKNRPFSKTGHGGILKFDPKSFTVSEDI